MLRRLVALPILLAVSLASGCASGSRSSPQRPGGGRGVASAAGSAQPAGLPSGILTSRMDRTAAGVSGTLLSVYDAASGNLLGVASAPVPALSTLTREMFDSSMTRIAYADCDLTVLALRQGRFTSVGQWRAPQSYGQGKQCFRSPAFHADGRIWATVSADDDPGRTVSIDPASPGAAPRDEGAGPGKRQEKIFRVAGLANSDVRVWMRGTRVETVSVNAVKPGGDWVTGDFSYDCAAHVDDLTLVCTSQQDVPKQYYGSVALVTVAPAAGTVTMRRVAPAAKRGGTLAKVFVSPDRTRLAIHDSTGWYTTALDGTATPTALDLTTRSDEEGVCWA